MRISNLGNNIFNISEYLTSEEVDEFLVANDYRNAEKYGQAGVYREDPKLTSVDLKSRNTKVISCAYDVNLSLNRKLTYAVNFINERYLKYIVHKYCIPTQLLYYNVSDLGKGFFHKHKDNSQLSLRVITGIVILSDPEEYTGCKLRFYKSKDDETGFSVDQKKGSIFVFPSETWHAIDPITSGERFSLVTWYKRPGGDPNDPI